MKAQSVGGGWSGVVTGYPLVDNKMTSGLMRQKPESADSSKSIEYVLYKVLARP